MRGGGTSRFGNGIMLRGGEEEVVRFRGEGGESSVQSGESGISGICDHRPLCAPTYSIRRYPPTTYLLRWRCGFAHFTALLILAVGVGDRVLVHEWPVAYGVGDVLLCGWAGL